MQEEVDEKTMALAITGGKISGNILKAALAKWLRNMEEKNRISKSEKREEKRARRAAAEKARKETRDFKPGKKSLKSMMREGSQLSNIEITDPSIKEFEKIARKYGVDYAVKKDRSSSPPKYLIFFKGRDADALTAAFTEYTGKKVRKAEKSERPSVLAKLSQFKELVKHAVVDRNKRKELER